MKLPEVGMTEEQRYLFDTFGYFIVPKAISSVQVQQLRSTLHNGTEQFDPVAQEQGPLHWSEIWRDLIDLPNISPILEELVGNAVLTKGRTVRAKDGRQTLASFRLDHLNIHTHIKQGYEGAVLHGGWQDTGGSQFFRYHDGRFYNGLVVVAIELFDTHPNDGGFCCIAGTHKSNLALPRDWADLSNGVHPCITRVPANAGDAIIFTEALTHGTLPWTADATRKTLFYKFSPHATSWSADFFNPDDFRQYADMDDRKLAILEPPNARYWGRPSRPERTQRE
ncbi:MAG: phytanoyl-CoA dioxygenase family protein [Pseudomonadales bacterium]|jgi:hypothetical protein